MKNWGRFFRGSEYGSKEEADFVNKPEEGIDIDKKPIEAAEKTPKQRVDAYKQKFGNYEEKPVDIKDAKKIEWFDRGDDSEPEVPKHLDALDIQDKLEAEQTNQWKEAKDWENDHRNKPDRSRQSEPMKGKSSIRKENSLDFEVPEDNIW